MDYVIEVYDPRGFLVTCSPEDFEHIKDRHPEVHDSELIETTIKDPCYIYTSDKKEDTEVYYKTNVVVLGISGLKTMRVFADSKEGVFEVQTAYCASPDKVAKGSLIWTKYTK